MRPVLLALLLSACATASSSPPDQRVAGCWIKRSPVITRTMRWRQDEASGRWLGDTLQYSANGSIDARGHYALAPRGNGWALCDLDASSEACWQVAQGASGSLEGGRAFIDAHADRLRIAVTTADGRDRVVFDGNRDGCD